MRQIDLDSIKLSSGSHEPDSQYCVMELAAFIAEEPWSDKPQCVSAVIATFLRSWNDSLDDETRQKLKPYAIKCLNTRGTREQEEKRAWLATDWLARECAPAFLRLAGLTQHAETLERLAPLDSAASARMAEPFLAAARAAARAAAANAAARAAAANAAARAAVASAAVSAAGSAAVNTRAWAAANAAAASAAARAAARAAAASAAAWAAANAAAAIAAAWDASDAAWAAANAAARAAVASAAVSAAGSAAVNTRAWAAANAAAKKKLKPTVKKLQASALLLLDRMIDVSKEAL